MFKTNSEFENLRHRMQRLLPLSRTLRLILYKDPDRLLPIFSHQIFFMLTFTDLHSQNERKVFQHQDKQGETYIQTF